MKQGRRSPIAIIASGAARHWKQTVAIWLVVIAIGIFAWTNGLAREGFPSINVPIAVVDGTYFVDDPETVDTEVTQPLAAEYGEIEGVVEVSSFARANTFAVVVEFDDEFSSKQGAALLEDANPAIDVPAEADVAVRWVDATKFVDVYDVLVSVSGPPATSPAELEDAAQVVADHLESTDAVAVADVRSLLTEGLDPQTGEAQVRQTRFTRVAYEDSGGYLDGVAVGLIRSTAADLDVLGFSDAVHDALDDLPPMPDGFRVDVTADFASSIRNDVGSLTRNLLTGLIAVAIVSFMLIGWRVSLVTALFMITVMLAALIAMWALGQSLNTITLFGLILTLGLLVDDAIVISEAIDSERTNVLEAGGDDHAVNIVGNAIGNVGVASLSGTLTTVLVFAPMLFIGGIIGEFIRAIPATVIVTLLISYVFSITFLPAAATGFLLRSHPSDHAFIKMQRWMSRGLGRLAGYPSGNGFKGWAVGGALVAVALGFVVTSFSIASSLGFTIFPSTKDSNGIQMSIDFDNGVTIEEAMEISEEADRAIVDTLGDDLVRSQYVRGNERTVFAVVDLVHFDERSTTSPRYAELIEAALGDLPRSRVSVKPVEQGPPTEDFPFAVQIKVDDAAESVAAGNQLAEQIRSDLIGRELDKTGGQSVTIIDSVISTAGSVNRVGSQREIEVRASFSDDEVTANLDATETYLTEKYDADALVAMGLRSDALRFDFGLESDNQDDFAGLLVALLVAVGLMIVLLVLQFRSILQPGLIFLAVPFSFFGVFGLLSLSDNPLSFFVMVGFIALVGVVVNNTILLIDAANRSRRSGVAPGPAIANAVTQRARPLVATTLTTVVGLLPLALSDPFWEALSLTLIGGLVSSTILVLLAFPVFYLAVEKFRGSLPWVARRGSLGAANE